MAPGSQDNLCINWSPRAAKLGNSWTWIAGWSNWTYARLIDNQVSRVSRVKSNELSDKHVSQLLIIFRIRDANGVNVDLLMNFSVMFICCIWNVDCDSHCIYIYIWIYILKRAILMKVLVCDSVWFNIFILLYCIEYKLLTMKSVCIIIWRLNISSQVSSYFGKRWPLWLNIF